MKLSKNSEILMSFFIEKKCINHIEHTKRTDNILKQLLNNIKQATKYVNNKLEQDSKFYKLTVTKLSNISQIPRPQTFSANSFPKEIREHINNMMLYNLSYTFSLFNREITIQFIVETSKIELQIELYHEYVEKILVLLYIINEYASKKCSKKLFIYLYFTSLKKNLPSSNTHILNENNVNTAFTHTCQINSEIVIFRKEEWFKVLMHESFHNFALDFSDMNISNCTNHILNIFKVKSDVNLFEAYTEFWAEIMNAVFCSFYLLKSINNDNNNNNNNDKEEKEFLSYCEFFINFERTYKFFQMVKTLKFMGLKYTDLYSNTLNSSMMREALYKEKTNVLAYYILTTILMNNYQDFLFWCDKNNSSLLQFKKTESNLNELCIFIEKKYKTKSIIDSVNCMQQFILRLQNGNRPGSKNMKYLLNNMRMSICELG